MRPQTDNRGAVGFHNDVCSKPPTHHNRVRIREDICRGMYSFQFSVPDFSQDIRVGEDASDPLILPQSNFSSRNFQN